MFFGVLAMKCISIAHSGQADIKDHLKFATHKAGVMATASTSSSSKKTFFKNDDPIQDDCYCSQKGHICFSHSNT